MTHDKIAFWFEADSDDLGAMLITHVAEIENRQSYNHELNRRNACLYSGREHQGFWSSESYTLGGGSSLYNNVIKQVIDTASSIVAKNKPRLRVQTFGGQWDDREKAKSLEKFLWGEFTHREVYDVGPDVFRDACIFGTGCYHVFNRDGKIQGERVLIDEIVVDEDACIASCKPEELFRRRLVDKNVLARIYPKHAAAIEESSTEGRNSEWCNNREVPRNMVVVVEGWRKGPKGKYAAAIEGVLLEERSYKKEDFPFEFYYWSKPAVTGFYGQGICEELFDLQVRLNQLNRFIAKCQDLIAVPRVFVDAASRTLKVQLTNEIGHIIPYRGRPPSFMTPQALNAEIYNERDRLIRQAFERIGVSQLSGQSLKPAGLESAVALREYNDIESQRFAIQAQRLERWYKRVGAMWITRAGELFSAGNSVKSVWASRNIIESIDWKDIDLEEDRFELSIEAASILTMSPAARLQAVTELAQVGVLEQSEIRYLLNHPDTERSDKMAYADFEDSERVLTQLNNPKAEFPTAEPFQNLELLLRRVQLGLLLSRTNGAPENVQERYRTFVAQAKGLIDKANAQGVEAGNVPAPGAAEPPTGLPTGPEAAGQSPVPLAQ